MSPSISTDKVQGRPVFHPVNGAQLDDYNVQVRVKRSHVKKVFRKLCFSLGESFQRCFSIFRFKGFYLINQMKPKPCRVEVGFPESMIWFFSQEIF
ncbi:unnamed protein product [Allacma fusca]|uniref:Uncharacterized protein n=1 Tax=Allacma fusca TaxID=39272 RepID=A0A8J2M8X1_9HEXA|nr:unnamed protein product [Allacma fusca]